MLNIMRIKKGMKFKNNLNGEILLITDVSGDKINYNFVKNQSKIPYFCTIKQFNEWINKVNGKIVK